MRLDATLQDRVAGLFGDVTARAVVPGGPLGLDDTVGREGRGAEVADLPRALQVGQGRERLLVAGRRVPTVDLVEVDVVDAEAAQAVVERGEKPAARAAPVVAPVAHRQARLGGEHDVVAAAGDGLADHLLGLAAVVRVGGVDEVDPGLKGCIDDGGDLVLGGTSDLLAEVHRAEHERADLNAGAAQGAVVHDWFLSIQNAFARTCLLKRYLPSTRPKGWALSASAVLAAAQLKSVGSSALRR